MREEKRLELPVDVTDYLRDARATDAITFADSSPFFGENPVGVFVDFQRLSGHLFTYGEEMLDNLILIPFNKKQGFRCTRMIVFNVIREHLNQMVNFCGLPFVVHSDIYQIGSIFSEFEGVVYLRFFSRESNAFFVVRCGLNKRFLSQKPSSLWSISLSISTIIAGRGGGFSRRGLSLFHSCECDRDINTLPQNGLNRGIQ